ncbi:MAG: penicillin acylase family protein [Antricoccus sp.]
MSEATNDAIEIYRDDWGIAHIRAKTRHDAFFAQGYVHAQDRMFHMDVARRQMSGRWAQWVGAAGVPLDSLARRLGADHASRRDYAALGAEAVAMCEAYSAGVNSYLQSAPQAPYEYRLLEEDVEPWEPWHCVSTMRQRGFMAGSLGYKLWRAAALAHLEPDQINKLRWDDGGKDRFLLPPGTDGDRWVASLKDLTPSIEALSLLQNADATGGGSNNWAVSGDRTESGRPIVAGDPHRAYEMPSMYVQQHLACEEFDAIGLTVPGVPAFPHFCHTADVAWGVTIAFADLHDLYIEQFDGDRYLNKDKWLPADIHHETISVRGAADIDLPIVRTQHGPVVAGDPASGVALTLKSIQLDPTDLSLDCLIPMLQAGTVDDFYDATEGWGLLDHNLVAADTSGTIGHLVRAIVPRRPAVNGWLPVPGWTGEYEWDGVIPFADMPRVISPARGYIATANNRVTGAIASSGDYFSTDAHPPHRCRRIEELLDSMPQATLPDMARIHRDTYSAPALLFRDKIAALSSDDPEIQNVIETLSAWDGLVEPDSTTANLYELVRRTLTEIVAQRSGLAATTHEMFAAVPPSYSPLDQLWMTLPTFVRNDDTSLLGETTWDEAIVEAIGQVASDQNQDWGTTHRALLVHPLAAQFPEHADTLSRKGMPVGGDGETVWANGLAAPAGMRATYGSVARYIFDIGQWNNCQWIVFSGASGDPTSSHYLDQHERWSRCELVPMIYDWQSITGFDRQALA